MSKEKPGTVIVTGGGRGIGAEVVQLFAQAGHNVLFTYASKPHRAQEVVDRCAPFGVKVVAVQADVRDPMLATAVVEQAQRLSAVIGLVNNAGITSRIGSFLDVDIETMRDVLDVNVLGTMVMCQAVVRDWVARGASGSIVNVSSIAATLGSPGEYIHYAGSKAAVEGFTIGLAKEFADRGIRANVVSPGTTDTEIHALSGEPGRAERVAPKIPMRRAGDPREIAEAIAWMLSDKASYVTGAVLRVAGGL
ncbi:SDR family NAD(P)-dependent oxidoreductase [Hydrogenophaga intermedia]|jgi:NAD(P)-dependent dehydrogenase (short-subunit alcohol dehydrogenase family)|uniref:SDR family NAD(P)-dependent oxidoreductase n=1 Tax=Hydrogenophaga intermedia TaxID=65786 RepID=UPI002043FC4E|nr:SDR family oxidoreductase [Hydrogenophaga intermedia]MCM3563390.1 SDR family oxidoreductase [Hydrogenophaga intermedia]